MTWSMRVAVIAAVVLVSAACSGDGSERVVSSSPGSDTALDGAPTTASATLGTSDGSHVPEPSVTSGTSTADTPAPPPTAVEVAFPPPGLPLRPASELAIGAPNLVGLIGGGDWLFAVDPPSTVMRIDPQSGEVARLDLELGESREGPVRQAFVAGSLWAIGGPFRDTSSRSTRSR